MNIRLVMYLLGKLSIACAVAMVVPMITALLLGEYMFLGFIFSFMICAFIGGALIGNGEKNKRAHLNLREALATVGCGWLLAPIYNINSQLATFQARAFASIVIGGFGSLNGAILGGIIVGLVEAYSSYITTTYKDVIVFGCLLLMLVFRPSGILKAQTKKEKA